MILSVLAKIRDFVRKCSSPTREVEHFLSKSVDRADFECREKHLKYKGIL